MLHKPAIEKITLELLESLMQKDYLKPFILVGGTALALHIGHRKSIDLDLFTNEIVDINEIKIKLQEEYSDFHLDFEKKNTLITKIQDIKVDFIGYKYKFNFPIIIVDGIRLADIKDIAPMKLDAITGRGRKKDFFDLYFLLEIFSFEEMFNLYNQKYQHSSIFHVLRSISYFEDAERDLDPFVFDKKITWTKVKNTIRKEIRKL